MTHKRSGRLAIIAAVAAVLGVFTAPSAWADGSPTVVVTGGSLTLTSPVPPNFTGVTLSGAAQTTTATIPTFSATDARGTGVGWRISVAGTQFCEQLSGATCVVSGKTLPVGSLAAAAPTVAAGTGSGTVPTVSALAGVDGATSTLASAALTNGMGTYNFGTSLATLSLAANVYAKTYVSTITYTLATGP
ncbi:MAG: WxL domain-containing protein [Microthrixaceae bacterium]